MSAQWYDPLTQTKEGQLLNDVRSLLKEVKNKKKADLDKDGQLSSYEKKRGKAIEESMARQGYKSDRGQKKAPDLPSPKGKKTFGKADMGHPMDMSDNCPKCGANPHEECGLLGQSVNHRAIDCVFNPISFDSRRDDLREPTTLEEAIDEGHMQCAACGALPHQPCGVAGMNLAARNCSINSSGIVLRSDDKASMAEKNKFCQKHFGRNYSECTPKQKAQCDRECGKASDVKKYEQEPDSSNSVPTFQNVDGGIAVNARGYTTNQRVPHTVDGIKKTTISEKANIPAYSQQGYAANSSSLHMHLTDGGNSGNPPNLAPIEERLASLTKGAAKVNQGVIGEIESLIKQVKEHLASE